MRIATHMAAFCLGLLLGVILLTVETVDEMHRLYQMNRRAEAMRTLIYTVETERMRSYLERQSGWPLPRNR
jgi:hypothetical protein